MPPEAELAPAQRPLTSYGEVAHLLRAGDCITLCHGVGWRLVAADAPVGTALAELMLRQGRLAPLGDSLPGILPVPAQSYRWVEEEEPAP